MKTFFSLVAICISILLLWDAPGEMFREEVVNGYRKQCLKAQAQSGMDREVKVLCGCQATVVGETFSSFDFLMAGVNNQLGRPVLEEKETKEIEGKVRACFEKAGLGVSLSKT